METDIATCVKKIKKLFSLHFIFEKKNQENTVLQSNFKQTFPPPKKKKMPIDEKGTFPSSVSYSYGWKNFRIFAVT